MLSAFGFASHIWDHTPVFLALAGAAGFLYRAYLATLLPKDLSLVGEKAGCKHFSLRTRLSFYFDCSALYRDVWNKFSKQGEAVLVPTLGTRNEIFLPHSSLKWALSQPATTLGMWEAFDEIFQTGHTLGHDKYMVDSWAHVLVRHVLTQELEDCIPAVHEELQLAMDAHLGDDCENWTTVELVDTMRMIMNRTGSRIAVGLPLCRDEDYLRTMVETIDSVVANAGVTGLVPKWLRPVVGPLVCWGTRARLSRLEGRYDGVLKKGIARIEAAEDGSGDAGDVLHKMLRFAHKHRREELATDQMTRRLVMTSLGFVYQAGFAASNMVLNVLASDTAHDTVAVLRREAEAFLAASGCEASRLWTKANAARMVHADSVARETLRLNTLPTRAVLRKVLVDGVRTDGGLPLPRGSLVSFVSQPMHTDAGRFEAPEAFDPFRFARLRRRAAPADDASGGGGSRGGGSRSRHAFRSTADLLVFGRGPNACPGRFLVDLQLKMLLSHLLTTYDLKLPDQHQRKPPASRWLLEFIFPPSGVKVMVRRRAPGVAEQ